MKKLKSLYTNSRPFRTFLQTFVGYVVANTTYALQQVVTGGEQWHKVLVSTLLIPAIATALSAIMNKNADPQHFSDDSVG